jgi:beta-galactosidase
MSKPVDKKPRWTDESCFEINREHMHAPLRAYESREAALGRRLCDELPKSRWMLPLTPAKWSFALSACPQAAPAITGPNGFDAAGWGEVHVPRSWELAEVGSRPIYLNHRYPFKVDPPHIPSEDNEVGSYQVRFTVPASWEGRRAYLVLDGIGSASTVWLDGVEVGYSQDSKLPAEFEVTKLLSREGTDGRPPARTGGQEHVLSVQVLRWCDGSYLEDQDQWWLSGIQRHCYLYSKPAELAIRDFTVSTEVVLGGSVASLAVEVALAGSLFDAAASHEEAKQAVEASDARVRASLHGPFRISTAAGLEQPLPACDATWAQKLSPLSLASLPDASRWSTLRRAAGPHAPDPHLALREDDAHGLMSMSGGPVRARGRTALATPALWSAEEPNLYSLVLELVVPKQSAAGKAAAAAGGRADGDVYVVDVETCLVGVRSVGISGGLLRVNGAPIMVKGVNRHEHTAEGGKAVSWESMLLDATMLKANNFNAVRTAHYPNTDAWYDLCAAVGLYVVDEANIETHGFFCWGDEGILAKRSSWRAAMLSRVTRMLRRDKNHAAVISWSLGNEAGYGPTHDAMAAWCRMHDPTRPVQYESCGGADCTDIICPMYPDVGLVRAAGSSLQGQNVMPNFGPTRRFPNGRRVEERPLILCEFAHAMGNSTGNYAEWWELFRSLPYAQGGFIWDWADQGLHKTDPVTGRHFWAYGGDFNCERHDGAFCINGLVFPDRQPHPALAEVKHVHRPVDATLKSFEWGASAEGGGDKGNAVALVSVTNGYDLRPDLDHLSLDGSIEVGGAVVGVLHTSGWGTLRRALGARASCELELPIGWSMEGAPDRPSEAYLTLRFRLEKATNWAEAGHEVACVQLHLAPPPPRRAEKPAKAISQCDPLLTTEHADSIEVRGRGASGRFRLVVCKQEGTIRELSLDGRPLLAAGSGALNLWRAPTDNDIGGPLGESFPRHEWLAQMQPRIHSSLTLQPLYLRAFYSSVGPFFRRLGVGALQSWADVWKRHSLHKLSRHAVHVSLIEQSKERAIIRCSCEWRTPWHKVRARHSLLLAVNSDGSITVHNSANVRQREFPWEAAFSLPRVGIKLAAAPELLETVRWLGCGPHENYPDRATGARFGIHTAGKDDLFTPYLVPSENGHRGGTAWLALGAADGAGLAVSSSEPFGWSAMRHGAGALEEAAHPSDLEPEETATLCLDHRMMGVGGDIAWGRAVWENYFVPKGRYSWSVSLTPFRQMPAAPPDAERDVQAVAALASFMRN